MRYEKVYPQKVPMVGYEHGPALALAQGIGFAMLHPLRVWTR